MQGGATTRRPITGRGLRRMVPRLRQWARRSSGPGKSRSRGAVWCRPTSDLRFSSTPVDATTRGPTVGHRPRHRVRPHRGRATVRCGQETRWSSGAGRQVRALPISAAEVGTIRPPTVGRRQRPSLRRRLAPVTPAFWGGDRMLVWGGAGSADASHSGGRYDPWTDSWSSISSADAPSPRISTRRHGLVVGWLSGAASGTSIRRCKAEPSMIPRPIIGRRCQRSTHRPRVTPIQRFGREAESSSGVVSSGDYPYEAYADTGGQYDPESDTWTPTSDIGAPSPRRYHSRGLGGRSAWSCGVGSPRPHQE